MRAIVSTHRALKEQPDRATEVGKRLFPPAEADMIAAVVTRDLPFYDSTIAEQAVSRMNQFAQDMGLLTGPVPYEQVVASRFRQLWTA